MSTVSSTGSTGPSAKRLLRRLRDGAGTEDAELRQALGLAVDAEDRALADSLVAEITARRLSKIKVSTKVERDPRHTSAPERTIAADSSFLGQLAAESNGEAEGRRVADLDDVYTLMAILRAGSLSQRRAAAIRLGARLAEGRDLPNDSVRAVSTTLLNMRDVEIAFEVLRACEFLPGARGRQARQETEAFSRIIDRLVREIDEFWGGASTIEPVTALPPESRTQLMVRMRAAPDRVLHHIGSVLDGSAGVADRNVRTSLLSSLRNVGDSRLVSPLVHILCSRQSELVSDAARALARIDDPRVHPALVAAYERSVVDAERALLAGALSLVDDVRGRDYVRTLLDSDDERVLAAALEAMEGLAVVEDCERLLPLLERTDPLLLSHAIQALGRAGNSRAMRALAELHREPAMSALWADVEDAEGSIRAQVELRGEEPSAEAESVEVVHAARTGLAERKRDPITVRFRSWFDFFVGNIWIALGALGRGIARCERAAGRRIGWAPPLAAIALVHARRQRTAQALAAFRRALEADRNWVERQSVAMRWVARIFLRRAEEVEQDSRVDIARGLIDEVLSLDLRRVPSELRFELFRRQEGLQKRLVE